MSRFTKAVRQKARLRMALDGPAGGGKSFTALRFAFAFPEAKVACIEAGENGGLSLYQGENPDGIPFDFDILELKKNFSPTEYTMAIEEAGREGYDVVVIDSLSHAWSGQGGALEQVGGAGFTDKDGWRKVTPQHNRMIDAILQSPCHVIATMRTKTEYLVEEDERGRKCPRKVGMAPIQRAGMEYEFTVYGSIDHSHTLTITKSRCPVIQDAIVFKPGAGFMAPVIQWLQTGETSGEVNLPKRVGDEQVDRIGKLLDEAKLNHKQILKGLEPFGVENVRHLTTDQADRFEGTLAEWLRKKKEQEIKNAAAAAATVAATSLAATANGSQQ